MPSRPGAPLPRILTRDFVAILAVQACFGYANAAFSLLPKFLDQELGASASQIGVVAAAAGVASVLAPFAVGEVVDRVGRRVMLAGGGLLLALSALAFAAVSELGPLVYALRALQGVAFGMAFVAGSALATDEAPPERLGQAMGIFGLTMLSMNAVAPLATEIIAEARGWGAAFAAAAAGGVACAALAVLIREKRHEPSGDGRPTLWSVARQPHQRRMAAVVVPSAAACGVMFTFHQTWALELGFERVGSFFAAYASAAIVVRGVFGRAVDTLGRHRVASVCLALYAVVVTATLGLEWIGLAPLGAAFGAVHGFLYAALGAIAVEDAAPQERSRVMALYIGAFNLGFAGGPFALGFLADSAGYPPVFATAGGLAFLSLAVFLATARPRREAGAAETAEPGLGAGSSP